MSDPISTLRLKILEDCDEIYVEFHVDGEDLGPRHKVAFDKAGFHSNDDVLPLYGGDYRLSDTVLGEEVRAKGSEHALLFACGCGQNACSSVSAKVIVADNTIALTHFSAYCSSKNFVADIKPITFERQQFDEAVRQLLRDAEAWRPRPN